MLLIGVWSAQFLLTVAQDNRSKAFGLLLSFGSKSKRASFIFFLFYIKMNLVQVIKTPQGTD